MKGDIYVAPHGEVEGVWKIGIEDANFDTQEEAIAEARIIAHEAGRELVIHGEDGQIREKDSHGEDPPEIEG